MIVSPGKLQDMQARKNILECMEICLRNGLVDEAKELGEASKKISKRILTYDYSSEDRFLLSPPRH